jgi:hypothetical protein
MFKFLKFWNRKATRQTEPSAPARKRKLGVIGAGSAGVLTLVHFCTWLDSDWEVYSIHNPARPILGIGESTNGEFVGLLERGIRFCLGNQSDLDALDATIKYGSKFMNWRNNSWINPLLDGNVAIHFNNFRFKELVFDRLEKFWPRQFRRLDGDVKHMTNLEDRVIVRVDDQDYEFDYVIDCMGTPSSYEGYTISDCTPVNRCQIHSITDYEYEPFTDHIAHENGWMFGVPLKGRKTYGYLYNDTITPKEEALAHMKQMLGVDQLEDKEYIFKCYYTRQMAEGRICKNGNKALFFEPLVANSIFIYLYTNRLIYNYILGISSAEKVNMDFVKAVQEMEDVISYYYHRGSIFQTPFWDYAAAHTHARLENRPEFKNIMRTYRQLKDRGLLYTGPVYGFKPLTWEIVDEAMGCGYIDDVVYNQEMIFDEVAGEIEIRLENVDVNDNLKLNPL